MPHPIDIQDAIDGLKALRKKHASFLPGFDADANLLEAIEELERFLPIAEERALEDAVFEGRIKPRAEYARMTMGDVI
jgi:hypothetical protein